MNKVKNKTKEQINKLQGIISISSKGTGYVAIGEDKDRGRDPEIDFKHLNTALHGDRVEIILHPKEEGKRQTAEVSRILSRAKTHFAGVLEEENLEAFPPLGGKASKSSLFFLKPDDPKMYTDILIPRETLNNAKTGQKVFVEIVSWEDAKKTPLGKVIKILGRPGDNNAEMNAIAIEKGFDSELPNKVEEEAEKIKREGISENDYKGRRDFRKILTFTIDPEDAKDFDDAISFRILPPILSGEGRGEVYSSSSPSGRPARQLAGGGWGGVNRTPQTGGEEFEIGIHIADVTRYVKIGSALDKEASKRGTSVYLVDRTIPMLPEILSNDLCSLVPNKDRLTMSAVFIVDKNANVKSEWFGRAVIHSQKRFTYKEAENIIKNGATPLHKEFFILNNLAKKLAKERFERGAISLDQEEVKFILDQSGSPVKIIKKERGDSERLIEEFMLLANKKVAKVLSKNISLYRIHDLPSKEKMNELVFFLKSLGHEVPLRNGAIPTKEINKLLLGLAGRKEKDGSANIMQDTVSRAVIRSMAKAVYSTKNIGHYGLAFDYYTHFTSPIRRYPDIVVHRLLSDYLSGKKVAGEKLREYEEIAKTSSEQEKRASDAERASIKYKQVEYMSKHLGKIFNGAISGVTQWGMYVEEIETKCEGLVRVRDMNDDFYIFNEKKSELTGQKKKKKYRLGDRVKVKVKTVDLERKTIDCILV